MRLPSYENPYWNNRKICHFIFRLFSSHGMPEKILELETSIYVIGNYVKFSYARNVTVGVLKKLTIFVFYVNIFKNFRLWSNHNSRTANHVDVMSLSLYKFFLEYFEF